MNDLFLKMYLVYPSDQKHLNSMQTLINNFLSDPGSPSSQKKGLAHKLSLAAIEAVTNSMVHGNKDGDSPLVEIEITLTEKWIEMKVRDTGPGYDLYKVPEPQIESCPTNGMGIHMIKEIMTSVSVTRRGEKNELKMTKVL